MRNLTPVEKFVIDILLLVAKIAGRDNLTYEYIHELKRLDLFTKEAFIINENKDCD